MTSEQKIESFHGKYRWLSNFWPAAVLLDGEVYASVEHAYVASKTFDAVSRFAIQSTPSPADVKRIGRKLVLRPDWEKVKLPIMLGLLRHKFRIPENEALLRSTGNAELIEGNTWGDTFWGVCRGVGKNNLGKLLMQVRSELIATVPNPQGEPK